MEIPKDTEVGVKFAAMSEAICDVLASIANDVLIFRKILAEKNLISDAECETALEAFERRLGKDDWEWISFTSTSFPVPLCPRSKIEMWEAAAISNF